MNEMIMQIRYTAKTTKLVQKSIDCHIEVRKKKKNNPKRHETKWEINLVQVIARNPHYLYQSNAEFNEKFMLKNNICASRCPETISGLFVYFVEADTPNRKQ